MSFFKITIREIFLVILISGLILALVLAQNENKDLRREVFILSSDPHLVLDQIDLETTIYSARDSALQVGGRFSPQRFDFKEQPTLEAKLTQVLTLQNGAIKPRVCGEGSIPLDLNTHRFSIDLKRTEKIYPGIYQYSVVLKDGDEVICKAISVAPFEEL